MGLLKDIHDIIAQHEPARKKIEGALLKFLAGGLFAKEPTRAERKEKVKLLIPQILADGFSSSFADILSFFAALLGTIAESAYASARGCVVEKLYLPGYVLYFPSMASEPKLGDDFNVERTGERCAALKLSDDSYYRFLAIKSKDSTDVDVAALRARLDEIVASNTALGERETFKSWLNDNGYEHTELVGIAQDPKTASLRYLPQAWSPIMQRTPLSLNFSDKSTKAALARDLEYILNYTVV